jgi:hypothetical protein
MGQLTFPIVPAGLVVDVMVNLPASTLMPLWSTGGGLSPIPGRALIDTGSDISAVSLLILRQLGISALLPTSTQGIGGSLKVNLYVVNLHVVDARNVLLPWFVQPSLTVMELDPQIPFAALIGMDIIRTCKLLVDGSASQFTLDF